MRQVFFRELKPYSLAGIANELDIDRDHARDLITRMMERNVLRLRNTGASDRDETDDYEECLPDERYQFVFVGIIIANNRVIVAYPKYFRDRVPRKNELKQLFRVLRKTQDTSILHETQVDGDLVDDKLPTILSLLDMYSEHGVYSNYIEGREKNGTGVIDWTRTIGQHLPLVDDEDPIYIDYESRKTFRDESDFITRLHETVLTECSKMLFEAGIADLLSLDEVWLSSEEVEQFGETETLLTRLERERSTQFVDWKISVLKLLEQYLLNREASAEKTSVHAMGTTNFPHIWESACKVAFGDKLSMRIDSLGIQLDSSWIKRRKDTLLQIIPRPKWERSEAEGFSTCGEVATLIPDTVAIASDASDKLVFCIYDAKYYLPSPSGKMTGQPGLESVTKQFLYQSAYRDFILAHGFSRVVNAFLVPSSSNLPVELARVSFPKVMDGNIPPFDNYIHMWALPAKRVFEAYLQEKPLIEMAAKLVKESEGA